MSLTSRVCQSCRMEPLSWRPTKISVSSRWLQSTACCHQTITTRYASCFHHYSHKFSRMLSFDKCIQLVVTSLLSPDHHYKVCLMLSSLLDLSNRRMLSSDGRIQYSSYIGGTAHLWWQACAQMPVTCLADTSAGVLAFWVFDVLHADCDVHEHQLN